MPISVYTISSYDTLNSKHHRAYSKKVKIPALTCIYLFVQHSYTCKVVSELMTQSPVRNKFSNYNTVFVHRYFCPWPSDIQSK